MPRPDNAIFSLSRAMAKLADYDPPPHLIPSTKEFFLTLAKTSKPPMAPYFTNLVAGNNPELVREAAAAISKDYLLHAIMRNTIAPVIIKGGFRNNVIPSTASATINLRILPGTNLDEFISEIKSVVKDPSIDVSLPAPHTEDGKHVAELMKMWPSVKPAPKETDLYRALESSAESIWPGAPVTPYLFQAGTDAIAWRARGVPVYGIYPYPISQDDLSRMHGNDERVSIESLNEGTQLIYKTLLQVASK
jgi:acetylornithine deacetylase/succinyl-diaminopimelate desuccinylase-like protein